MAINEQILTGRKWRRLIDKVTGLWQRISYWTHSTDVEFEDGKTAETKVGAIDGITDSLVSTSSNIAASAKALSQVNNNLMFPDGTRFYPDSQNGKYGFNTDPQRGADTFRPFNDIDFSKLTLLYCKDYYGAISYTYTLTSDYDYILAVAISHNPHSSYNGSTSSISYVSTEGELVKYWGHTLSPGDTVKYGSGCSLLVLKNLKAGDTITAVATVDGAVGIYGF